MVIIQCIITSNRFKPHLFNLHLFSFICSQLTDILWIGCSLCALIDQAPPPSSLDQAHEDLNSASSSPIASPAIVIDSLPTTPDGMRHRHPHLPHESTDPTSHHQALRPKPNPSSSMSVEGVGFEGPMLDFKSPTASDVSLFLTLSSPPKKNIHLMS